MTCHSRFAPYLTRERACALLVALAGPARSAAAGSRRVPATGPGFAPRLAALCGELAAHDERLRLLDWGDASMLVVTFRFLEERNKLPPADPWFARLHDAYLEPWGGGLAGTFAHTFAWARQRDYLPEAARPEFDRGFQVVLRRAVARTHQ
jgi:hypothetical protein